MGGSAFKDKDGKFLTTHIYRNEIDQTILKLKNHLLDSCNLNIELIGSTGKCEVSNDIDIVVGPISINEKNNLLKSLKEKFSSNNVKLVGAIISMMLPITGRERDFVQVDIMLSTDIKKTAWLMSGFGDSIKGKYRNCLLAFIAKNRSSNGVKVSMSFPGGIQVLKNSEVVIDKNEDPVVIFDILGIKADPFQCQSFEEIVQKIKNDRSVCDLNEFSTYIEKFINDPKTSSEALRAVSFISDCLVS